VRSDGDHDLLSYFGQELAALREASQDFARRHPRVAQGLDLSGQESRDPHVERLIESFAYLTGRLQRELDREFPRVASGILENVCPSLMAPVPSLSVAQLSPAQATARSRAVILPERTALSAVSDNGVTVRFQTTRSTTVWPIQIRQVELTDLGHLCITIEPNLEADLKALQIDILDLYLHGDWRRVGGLLDLIGSRTTPVLTGESADRLRVVSAARIQIPDIAGSAVSPGLPPGGHPAYLLLQEYFACPQRFNFLRVTGVRECFLANGPTVIAFDLGAAARRLPNLGVDHIKLGCVPVVNLFRRTSEPITLREDQLEYRLVADRTHEATTEIHSILQVTSSQPGAARPEVIAPHAAVQEDYSDPLCWISRRDQALREDLTGTDVFLSFVDAALDQPEQLPAIVYADVLCTNRGVAEQLPAGARLQVEGSQAGIEARLCFEPSRQRMPPLAGDSVWRLTQLLTLSHGSLIQTATAHKRLLGLLSLFAGSSRRDAEQISGLTSIRVDPCTLRRPDMPWQPFCPGLSVRLELDPQAFSSGSMVIFSGVIARFLSLYCSVDRFVQTSVWRGEDELISWPPMAGEQELL
jgi:type VI secretion system protein ImpG